MDSFIGWIGGKKNLRRRILEQFPAQTPKKYVEVFGGAGWVLFAKDKNPKQMEVYNDANNDLVNLFRCAKYHPEAVERELDFLLQSRVEFHNFKEQIQIEGLTDIQRAARFLYLIRYSFGCNMYSFATLPKSMRSSLGRMRQVHERLADVIIENKDFENLIAVYDSPDTLFYLDPPYYGTEKYYKYGFTDNDHRRLCEALKGIKGKFLLSYNDSPHIRELYQGFHIEAFTRKTMLEAHSGGTDYGELLIKNY